jgi:hypothetical protein
VRPEYCLEAASLHSLDEHEEGEGESARVKTSFSTDRLEKLWNRPWENRFQITFYGDKRSLTGGTPNE